MQRWMQKTFSSLNLLLQKLRGLRVPEISVLKGNGPDLTRSLWVLHPEMEDIPEIE